MMGPALPAGFTRRREGSSSGTGSDSDGDSSASDTAPGNQATPGSIGPSLPPGFKRCHGDSDKDDEEQDAKRVKTRSLGPELPPGFQQAMAEVSDSDDDVIGPVLPSSSQSENYSAASDIERRAQKMRRKLMNDEDPDVATPKSRDTWMTELPQQHELSGLAPRMPVAKTRLGDGRAEIDHSWTQLPGDKSETSKSEPKKEEFVPSQRDKEMAAAVAEYDKSRRATSLLEMHQKKMEKKKKKKEKKDKKEKKKKKKKEKEKKKEKKEERRPFDRDLDLKANAFDDAKKKALIKKSQVLNSRFGHGAAQYL